MVMFESLLLFVQASRQGHWRLHLASMNNFAKYFFAHDQLNYARLTPFYLAGMLELEGTDATSWTYLEINYSIVKTSIPFVGIGSDHAMEQENKNLKVAGGIVGLTQQSSALSRFCLSSPVMSSLAADFLQRNNRSNYETQHHYQLSGSTKDRIHTNVKKIVAVMESFSFGFEETDCVHNVVSKAVLPQSIANDVLNHSTIGENLYKAFIGDRINGATSIWAPMKKCRLGSFKIQVKSIRSKVGEKMVQLKEEKNLMSRFFITARKRPELDLEHYIGNYEFSVVPRALFYSVGLPLPCIDKSKLMLHLEEMAGISDEVTSVQENSVIIIDGMAVVNQICKDATLKTCKVSAFLKSFVRNYMHSSNQYL